MYEYPRLKIVNEKVENLSIFDNSEEAAKILMMEKKQRLIFIVMDINNFMFVSHCKGSTCLYLLNKLLRLPTFQPWIFVHRGYE